MIEATKSTLRNDTTISKVIYISLGVTSAILLLAIAIIVWCYRRTKKKTVQRYEPFMQMRQPHRTASVCTRKLKQRRFLRDAQIINQKSGLLPFNYAFYRFQCELLSVLYSYKDGMSTLCGKPTAQDGKKSTSGWRASLENVFS